MVEDCVPESLPVASRIPARNHGLTGGVAGWRADAVSSVKRSIATAIAAASSGVAEPVISRGALGKGGRLAGFCRLLPRWRGSFGADLSLSRGPGVVETLNSAVRWRPLPDPLWLVNQRLTKCSGLT